jgi:hypothetical protein
MSWRLGKINKMAYDAFREGLFGTQIVPAFLLTAIVQHCPVISTDL